MKTNIIEVELTLTEQGLRKFKNIPTFKNLLHANQLKELKEGANRLKVNHNVWGGLQRVVGYDIFNMNVRKLD